MTDDFPAILDAAASGDGPALEALFTRFNRPILAFARSRGSVDPDGIVNDTFLRAFRRIDRFRGDESGFRSWLFRIARNLIVDERRKLARRPREVAVDAAQGGVVAPDAESAALANVVDPRLAAALAALTDVQREVVLLRIVGDLSVEETAKVLRKRPGAVKALLHRALATLRREMSAGP